MESLTRDLRRCLGRVLQSGSKTGLREGTLRRNTPFREYNPLRVHLMNAAQNEYVSAALVSPFFGTLFAVLSPHASSIRPLTELTYGKISSEASNETRDTPQDTTLLELQLDFSLHGVFTSFS